MKSLSRAAVIAAVRKTSLTVAAGGNGVDPLFPLRPIMVVLLRMLAFFADGSSLLYRNYYQLKYSWNFLKKVKWLSDIRQPFFDLLR